MAQSAWGDFDEALSHLTHKLIVVPAPEELRGGGLLKLCTLLARGHRHPPWLSGDEQAQLEARMCARFFADFPSPARLRAHIITYIRIHFHGQCSNHVARFLQLLHAIVARATRGEHAKALSVLDDLLERAAPGVTGPDSPCSQQHDPIGCLTSPTCSAGSEPSTPELSEQALQRPPPVRTDANGAGQGLPLAADYPPCL